MEEKGGREDQDEDGSRTVSHWSENNMGAGRRPMDRAACRGIREQHRGRREKTDG